MTRYAHSLYFLLFVICYSLTVEAKSMQLAAVLVEVEGVGIVEFPDGTTQEEISEALNSSEFMKAADIATPESTTAPRSATKHQPASRMDKIISKAIIGAMGGAVFGVLAIGILILREGTKKFRLGDTHYRRKIVSVIALIAALGMSLFPPWRLDSGGRSLDRGYALLFDPPHPQALVQIDLAQLGVQLAILCIIALIAGFLIKN